MSEEKNSGAEAVSESGTAKAPEKRSERKRRPDWGMFCAGVLWGVVVAFVFGVIYLRSALIIEEKSPLGFVETFQKLRGFAADSEGWVVKPVSCSLPQPKDGSRVAVMKICHGKYAARLLDAPESRGVSAMIPCSLAVYEKDGETYVARLNVKLLGELLGGTAAKVFPSRIAPDQDAMVEKTFKSKCTPMRGEPPSAVQVLEKHGARERNFNK